MVEVMKPQHIQTKVNLDDLPVLKCHCGSEAFCPVFSVRYMSALVAGQARLVQVPRGYVCAACGVDNDFTNIETVTGIGGIQPSSKYQQEEADDYTEPGGNNKAGTVPKVL